MEKPLDSTSEDPGPTLKTQSLIAGITNEWKPNSYINKSVCGETWHEFYLQDSSEGSLDSNDCKCQAYLKSSKCLFELRYTNLLEKYFKETNALKEKISELRNETEMAYEEISRLKTQVASIQQDYTLQIHNIQARHQQKMLRTKNDIEALVKSIEAKLEAQFKIKYEQVLNGLKNDWEEKIEKCKISCEEKVSAVRNEYEIEIIRIQEDGVEEERRRVEEKVKELLQSKVLEEVKKVEERYEVMLKKVRKENLRKKEVKKVLEISLENSNSQVEMQEKLESYQKHNKELQDIIISQEKNIQEMSACLSLSFKKKPKKHCDFESTFSLSIFKQ